MPLFAINLPDAVFDSIKKLIEQRRYRDVEAFVEVAALNQLALERGTSPTELARKNEGERTKSLGPDVAPNAGSGNEAQRNGRPEGRNKKPADGKISRTSFVLEKKPSQDTAAEALEGFARFGTAEVLTPAPHIGLQDRIFGQVNRLFPFKVACRGIANVALSNGRHWPDYSAVHDLVGERASKLGSLLEKWDLEHDRKRDEQLATGLPKRGNSASRDRFVSQLVARVTRAGEAYPGALFSYQLTGFDGDGRVALTEDGLAFAALANPVLDVGNSQVRTTLSDEEVLFLTDLILRRVFVERQDMSVVLRGIADGHSTPTELSKSIRTQLKEDWTDGMLLTHISGLVARLADLRLIRRKWDGRFVKYEIGDKQRAEAFL